MSHLSGFKCQTITVEPYMNVGRLNQGTCHCHKLKTLIVKHSKRKTKMRTGKGSSIYPKYVLHTTVTESRVGHILNETDLGAGTA